jgi:uncharacterized protein YndB with AHSA1/START domain
MPEAVTAREITVRRVLDAPRELVWNAWTDAGQLARWWGPPGWSTDPAEVTMDVRPGGELRLTSVSDQGERMPVVAVYREVDQPARLIMEEPSEGNWHEGALTEVTFTDLGDARTELVLRTTIHTSEEMARHAEGGMHASVARLAELVAGGGR